MAQIALSYSAAQIDAAIAKINSLITTIEGNIVQMYNGTTAIYPRTKAEAVFFDNDTDKNLDQQFSQLEQIVNSINEELTEYSQQEITNPQTVQGYYANNQFISDSASYAITHAYLVNKNDKIRITGKVVGTVGDNYGAVVFSQNLRGNGTSLVIVTNETLGTNIDIMFIAPSNGYINCWDFVTGVFNYNVYKLVENRRTIEEIKSTIEELQTDISGLGSDVDELQTDVENIKNAISNYAPIETAIPVNGYFINTGSFVSETADYAKSYAYAVNSGEKIRVSGIMIGPNNVENYYGLAMFVQSIGSNGTVFKEVKKEEIGLPFSVDYVAPDNGYILVWEFTNTTPKYSISKNQIVNLVEKVDELQDVGGFLLPLKGKSLAILGDSIMMLMRTNSVGTNIITYEDANGNAYNYDDLTNIGGLLYVTSTLKDGIVVDTTIQVFVTNSQQSGFNSQNWSALKNRLGVSELINCGLGGATLCDRDITTDTPAPESSLMTCLPNECRWLKKQVDSGRVTPDCIMIWAGTNGVLSSEPNNFNTIMEINWNILSADTDSAKTYRKTFYGGLRYVLEFLSREYPNATIFVFSPIQSGVANRTYQNIQLTGNCIKKMAERYSVIFVDAMTQIGIVDLFEEAISGTDHWLADGLHPNLQGKTLYSNFTAKKLNELYFSKTEYIG